MVEKCSKPIGVFDSGVGGLTVLTVLKNKFPNEDFLYVGDTGNTPYGNRTPEEITALSVRIAEYLSRKEVKLAVVACNTITVVALEEILKRVDYPIIGVCKGVHTAIDISPKKKIGIMATVATINSHKHKQVAQALNDKVEIFEQACPEFAYLIERGHIADDIIDEKVDEYLEPLVSAGVDTIILGCTHFPFIKKLMERKTGHNIVYVDPAHETAAEMHRVLTEQKLFNPQRTKGKIDLQFTSNTERANRLASLLIPPKEYTIGLIEL